MFPKIIHEDQKGFMRERYIGENIRLLYDIVLYAENKCVPGLLLMVHFEKAFAIKVDLFFIFGPDLTVD